MKSKSLLMSVLIAGTVALPVRAEESPQQIMALNLYHEGRGEGRDGMVAVGWVVLNRVADESYPNDVVSVIKQSRGSRCEWGWWCDGKSDQPTEPEMWALSQEVAKELLGESPPTDPTKGALWFHETFRDRPGWMGDDVVKTVTLGGHHFYGLK